MSTRIENIKVEDQRGFIYNVMLEHEPHFGFSTALYDGVIIEQVEYGRILEPLSDDDKEWEMYEECFGEWRDEIITNILPLCHNYFNKRYK